MIQPRSILLRPSLNFDRGLFQIQSERSLYHNHEKLTWAVVNYGIDFRPRSTVGQQ